MSEFSIRKTLYKYRGRIKIIKDIDLFVTKNTMKVQYEYKGIPIIKQFMIPFNEVYHLINGEFSSEVMRLDKNWFVDNIYIFLSFTLRSNIEKLRLPFKYSEGSKESGYDKEYRELYSVTYDLGRDNVLKLYKGFIDMIEENNLEVGKIAYVKVHRISNGLDKVNLVDFNKFKKLLHKGQE